MKSPKYDSSGKFVGSLTDILISAQSAYDTGDHVRADEILRQVLEAHPKVNAAWKLRGIIALKQGHLTESSTYFRQSLALAPDDAGTLFYLANGCLRDLDYAQAIQLFERSITSEPDIPEVYNNLSTALRLDGRPSDAMVAAQRALQLNHSYGEANNNLGLAFCDLRRYPEAIRCFESAIDIDANNLEALNNLGVALDAKGDLEKSLRIFERALILSPQNIDTKINLGNLFRKIGRLDEAAAQFSEVLDYNQADLRAHANLGLTLITKNRPEEAIVRYEKALALAPETPDIRMSLGIAQLMLGDFEAGWQNYEARWLAPSFAIKRRSLASELWTGQSLEGKSILVYAEQGFGDTIQFVPYVPMIAKQAGQVVFECQKALLRICSKLEGVSEVVARGDFLPQTDFHIPLMSLPHRMDTRIESLPLAKRYLNPPGLLTQSFRNRLQSSKPAIGLVWSGNPERQDDGMRSCPPEALTPLLRLDNYEFVSLQIGTSIESLSSNILDFGAECHDFADTAAAIEALDLIITVDTATAHLAGALSKDVWVMLGHHADWRYLMNRSDSPWYPSMRLYRQQSFGDWKGVVRKIRHDLSAGIRKP